MGDSSGSPTKAERSEISGSVSSRPTSRRGSGVPSLPKLQAPSLRRPAKTFRQGGSARTRATPRTSRSMVADSEEPDSPTYSRAGSVCGSSLLDTRSQLGDDEADSLESCADNVKVLVRIRPPTADEAEEGACVAKATSKCVKLQHPQQDAQTWNFDFVAGETSTQDEMFQVAGLPLVENCLAGYNSSILAYGQTGSGKTHTMQGSLVDLEQRGLSLRVLEWLFTRIAEEEAREGKDNLRYTCKCSFLEIFNETVTDLLRPEATNLQLREDVARGCFVDGLSEEVVLNAEDAASLLRRGAQNRKVGQTRMNRESSRSHSVYTITVESASKSETGLTSLRFSRLNLVDLAGSERNKASGARGGQLKEACHINQSLSTLGRVIMELVDAQRSRRPRHIPYRDSRLTYLLQDGLGGNAKSMIIACVSPALASIHETQSTLQFVSRAKQIRNKPSVNRDTQAASAELLKWELQRVCRELELAKAATPEPLLAEVASLSAQLQEARREEEEARTAAAVAASQARLVKSQAKWAEERVAQLESERCEAMALLLADLDPPGENVELLDLVRQQCRARAGAAEEAQQAQERATQAQESSNQVQQTLAVQREEAAGLALCVAQHEAEAAGLERQVAAIREELVRRDDALRTERAAQQEQLESLKTGLERATADAAQGASELARERERAAEFRVAAEEAARKQAAEGMRLQSENQTLRAALAEARQRESDAVLKNVQLKHMMADISSIINWARSPATTPSGAGNHPSFRRSSGASPRVASHNPLFAQPSPGGQPQQWSRPGGFLSPLEAPIGLLQGRKSKASETTGSGEAGIRAGKASPQGSHEPRRPPALELPADARAS